MSFFRCPVCQNSLTEKITLSYVQTDTVSILQDKAMSISFVPEDMVSAVMETTNAWYLPAPPFWT